MHSPHHGSTGRIRQRDVLMRRASRIWSHHMATCAYLIVTAVVYFASLLIPHAKVLDGAIQLKDPAETAVALAKDISALSGTWAAAILGASGIVCVKGHEWSRGWTRLDSLMVVVALAGGVLTYYGMYVASVAMFGMAAAGAFAPLSQDLSFAIAIQYYSALIGTLILGLVFARMLDRKIG
jgi:hypothetical protein